MFPCPPAWEEEGEGEAPPPPPPPPALLGVTATDALLLGLAPWDTDGCALGVTVGVREQDSEMVAVGVEEAPRDFDSLMLREADGESVALRDAVLDFAGVMDRLGDLVLDLEPGGERVGDRVGVLVASARPCGACCAATSWPAPAPASANSSNSSRDLARSISGDAAQIQQIERRNRQTKL